MNNKKDEYLHPPILMLPLATLNQEGRKTAANGYIGASTAGACSICAKMVLNVYDYHITESQINKFLINKFKINPSKKISLWTTFVGEDGYYSKDDIGYYFNTYIFPELLLRTCIRIKKICDYEYCGFRGRLYIYIRRKE